MSTTKIPERCSTCRHFYRIGSPGKAYQSWCAKLGGKADRIQTSCELAKAYEPKKRRKAG